MHAAKMPRWWSIAELMHMCRPTITSAEEHSESREKNSITRSCFTLHQYSEEDDTWHIPMHMLCCAMGDKERYVYAEDLRVQESKRGPIKGVTKTKFSRKLLKGRTFPELLCSPTIANPLIPHTFRWPQGLVGHAASLPRKGNSARVQWRA